MKDTETALAQYETKYNLLLNQTNKEIEQLKIKLHSLEVDYKELSESYNDTYEELSKLRRENAGLLSQLCETKLRCEQVMRDRNQLRDWMYKKNMFSITDMLGCVIGTAIIVLLGVYI